jgi:hypothetical protein
MRLLFISMTLAACGVTTSAVGFDTTTEIGIAAEVVGTDLVPDIGANRTFRIWAVTPEGWRIEAVAGNSEVSMRFEVIGGHFYQHDISEIGGPTSADINPALFSFYPDLEWDSFMTIGLLTDVDNELLDIGIDWTVFEDSDEETGGLLEANNGAITVTVTYPQGDATTFEDACGRSRHGVLISQLTLVGDGASLEGSVLLQGRNDLGVVLEAHITSFAIDANGVSDALPCAADITADGQVNVTDLLHLLEHWYEGACEDLTHDAIIDVEDVLLILDSWGACPV